MIQELRLISNENYYIRNGKYISLDYIIMPHIENGVIDTRFIIKEEEIRQALVESKRINDGSVKQQIDTEKIISYDIFRILLASKFNVEGSPFSEITIRRKNNNVI